ncbi:MAG: hypothetical protein EOM40_17900 [Clostridia bacterium]|nr:hypothetical protein [Clostridia bacterium]
MDKKPGMRIRVKIRNMMRAIFIALFLTGIGLNGDVVHADAIFEPENSFYENHRQDCEYVDRSYTADGPEGIVELYESPESSKVIETAENGSTFYVSFSYTDGESIEWAICENNETGSSGWVPMEYLSVVYDEISFEEEYGESITEESGALDSSNMGKTVNFWRYPGSEEAFPMEIGNDYTPEYSKVFVDEQDRRWGFISYYK